MSWLTTTSAVSVSAWSSNRSSSTRSAAAGSSWPVGSSASTTSGRETVGVVFQEFRLIPDLTARENAALPGEHDGSVDGAWLSELFERLDVADRRAAYPAALSGGEKQRVAVARALVSRPDVVLADEPTGQLDPAAADRVLELLFELQAETDTALVVVSHDPRLVDRFERRYRLTDGRLRTA